MKYLKTIIKVDINQKASKIFNYKPLTFFD